MKESRDRTKLNVGTRLAGLRKERGISQSQFAEEFSNSMGVAKQMTIPSVSSWEQNHRLPTLETLIELAKYYEVSLDYLVGITDQRDNTWANSKQEKVDELIKYGDVPISNRDFVKYDGQPVYVRSKTLVYKEQWGILDYKSKSIACTDFNIPLTNDIECYPYAMSKPIRTQINTYEQLMSNNYVWVEMKTKDPDICGSFNGRYTHNKDKSALIKMDNGQVLKYTGLDTVYWAFRG